MKGTICLMLFVAIALCAVVAQTPQTTQKPQPETPPEDVIRITTSLVQTDVVVTDKNDQAINDLKLEDFEIAEDGKPQKPETFRLIKIDAETQPSYTPRGLRTRNDEETAAANENLNARNRS